MKLLRAIGLALATLALGSLQAATEAATETGHGFDVQSTAIPITITPATRHQHMDGFGAALSWNLNSLYRGNEARDNAINKAMFEDLGLDILRFKNWYYPDDSDSSSAMNSHSVVQEAYQAAKAANPNIQILYSSWSPPEALKSNGERRNGGTLTKDTEGNYEYEAYADYWVELLDNLGWTPEYLSFQNEPGYTATWETCVFEPTETSTRAGYIETADAIWDAIKDRPEVPKMVGSEAENMPAFFRFNQQVLTRPYFDVHGYHVYDIGNPNQIDSSTTINRLRRIRDEFGDRPNWQTEFSREFNWIDAARVVHNTLVEADASAYIYWMLFWGRDRPESMIEHVDNNSFQINPTYYTVKHYSRHIHQGHQRIEVAGSNNQTVRVSGFISPDGNQITLVAINRASSSQEISLVPVDFPVEHIEGYQSVMDDFYQPMAGLTATDPVPLPASSMTTLVLTLVDGPLLAVEDDAGATIELDDTSVMATSVDVPVWRNFTLSNDGTDDLLFSGSPDAVIFAESGSTSHNGFTISSNIPAEDLELAPGESTSFTVSFETATPGTYTATVSIASNDASGSPFTFTVMASTETYPVSYDGNGNTAGTVPAPQTKQHGIPLTLALNTGELENDDLIFNGWNTSPDGSGDDYAEGAEYVLDEDVTLYASWRDARVFLTESQPFNHGPGWTDGSYWSNEQPAVAGNDYAVFSGRAVHTPDGSGTQTFPGDSLTLGNESSVGILRLNRGSTVGGRTTIVNNLEIIRGRFESTNWATLHTLQTPSASIPIETSLSFRARSSDSQNRTAGFIIDAALTGEDVDIVLEGRADAPDVPNQLRLIRANPISGTIRATDFGELVVGHQNALQNLTLDRHSDDTGTVTFNQNSTLGGLTGSGNVDFGGRIISVGNNSADTTFSGSIDNGALVKVGAGALTLAGANNYTGPTTVNAGVLRVDGSLATGASVTVNDGGAITGSGTISGDLSLADGGTYMMDGDVLTVSGTVTLDTGAFLEAGDLTPADASPIVLMTYGALTGTFGSVDVPLGWSVDYAYDGDSVALVAETSSGYLAWAIENGLTGDDADPLAEPAGDGLANLLKFAFDIDPHAGMPRPLTFTPGGEVTDPGLPFTQEISAAEPNPPFQAVFARRKDHLAAGLNYSVEFSADLVVWTPNADEPVVLSGAESTSAVEAVAVAFPAAVPTAAAGDQPAQFFRVRVSMD